MSNTTSLGPPTPDILLLIIIIVHHYLSVPNAQYTTHAIAISRSQLSKLLWKNAIIKSRRMKVTALLIVFISIAGIVLQDDGASGDSTKVKTNNAKVDKSGILLARCRRMV